jgi:Putative beta-barrel porin-2, OmpL-like. bbp2
MRNLLSVILLLAAGHLAAQQDSIQPALTVSAYLETYYTYDLGNPDNHTRPAFVYSHNRHNEVNLNLGLVRLGYQTAQVRANIGLMAGTYSNANLAAEPGVLKNVYEANVGFKIAKHKNLWVDAGIFASHIGFESAIGKDCWNPTRSMLADNSPYYESGAKLTYTTDNGKWLVSGLLLNGWQRIQRVDGNNTPAFGHQLTYKPSDKITLNSSSFVGSDSPDENRLMRYFHNFYAQAQLSEKVGLIAGFDIGAQQKVKGSSDYNTWYSPVVILRFTPVNRLALALRGEYYQDINGVIVATGTQNGFQTLGYSLNLDYQITSNALWRIEARGFSSKDPIFTLNNESDTKNYFFTTAFAISF